MSAGRVFLIADDSPGKLATLRGLLHASGWKGEVVTADTTESAMQKVDEAQRIDAAFIDYYIPSANGPAIIRHLRAKFPHAKIALASSADNPENAQKARDAGANAVLCTTLPDSDQRILNLLHEWRMEWTA